MSKEPRSGPDSTIITVHESGQSTIESNAGGE